MSLPAIRPLLIAGLSIAFSMSAFSHEDDPKVLDRIPPVPGSGFRAANGNLALVGGNQAAAAMLGWMPELGALTKKTAPSLLGVCPCNCDSGAMRGRMRCYGGRFRARASLYMASLSAARHGTELAAFYHRLTSAGKPAKKARVAVMRKLIIHLNTILKPVPHAEFLPN